MAFAVAPEPPPRARTAHDCQSIRTSLEADALGRALIDNLHCLQAKPPGLATRNDWYMALAYTVRDRMMQRYIETLEAIGGTNTDAKVVAYLSAEFLTGPHLGNGLINLGIWEAVEATLSRLGQDLSSILEQEQEPGLGNGGLGRLAACYMATSTGSSKRSTHFTSAAMSCWRGARSASISSFAARGSNGTAFRSNVQTGATTRTPWPSRCRACEPGSCSTRCSTPIGSR